MIIKIAIAPGGTIFWRAQPGAEIHDIDLVTGRRRWLAWFWATNYSNDPIEVWVDRGSRGELILHPYIYDAGYRPPETNHYPMAEPDFGLDEIHKAQELINEDRRLGDNRLGEGQG